MDWAFEQITDATDFLLNEESFKKVSLEGMCSPPKVISGSVKNGAEAEWFKAHPCQDLSTAASIYLYNMAQALSSVFPVRSEFTCDGMPTEHVNGIIFGITIEDTQVFVGVKHLEEPKGLESSAKKLLKTHHPLFLVMARMIAFAYITFCWGLLFYFVTTVHSKCDFFHPSFAFALFFILAGFGVLSIVASWNRVYHFVLFSCYPIKHCKISIDASFLKPDVRERIFKWRDRYEKKLELEYFKDVDPRLYNFRNSGDVILYQLKNTPYWWKNKMVSKYSFTSLNSDEMYDKLFNQTRNSLYDSFEYLKEVLWREKKSDPMFKDKQCHLFALTYNLLIYNDVVRADPVTGDQITYSTDSLNKYFHFDMASIIHKTSDIDLRFPIMIAGSGAEEREYFDRGNPDAWFPLLNSCCGWVLDVLKLFYYLLFCCGEYKHFSKINLVRSFYNVIWKYGNKRYFVKLNTVDGMSGSPVTFHRGLWNEMNMLDESDSDTDIEIGGTQTDTFPPCLGIVAAGVNTKNYGFDKSTVLQPIQYAEKLMSCREAQKQE